MFLIEAFSKSTYNLPWLKAQKNNVVKAWGYFALLSLLMSVLIIIPSIFTLPSAFKELRSKTNNSLPQFTATIKNGTLSVTDLPQPYVYKDQDKNFVLIIDTVSTSTPTLKNYLENEQQSGLLISAQGAEFYDVTRPDTKSEDWKSVKDTTLNRDQLLKIINQVTGTGAIILIMLLLLIILYLAFFLSKLFVIFLVSAIVSLAANIAKKDWKFNELFTVSLFAITLPALIALVFDYAGIILGYLHFLALLAFMLAVVFTKEDKVAPEIVPVETGIENK